MLQKYKIPLSLDIMLHKIFGICFLLIEVMSCTLEEAKIPVHRNITVFTDQYVPADSSFIKDFEQYNNTHVNVVYKDSRELRKIIQGNRYNTGFDLIITQSDTLRSILKERDMLYKISNSRLFRNLNRQFNNNHYLWLPIAHNPLILAVKLDSNATCSNLNWNKIVKDSTTLDFKIGASEIDYFTTLEKANSRYASLLRSKHASHSSRILIKLADYVVFARKNSKSCGHILNEHQRMFTIFTSISINKYARNKAEAIRFLDHYGKFSYQIASNRNQLPTFNGIIFNYQISELKLNQ